MMAKTLMMALPTPTTGGSGEAPILMAYEITEEKGKIILFYSYS